MIREVLNRWSVGTGFVLVALALTQPAVGQLLNPPIAPLLIEKNVQCPQPKLRGDFSPCEAPSADGRYVAVLTVGEAGAQELSVREVSGSWRGDAPTRDVTGIVWGPRAPVLFFTVSPIYGKPGVYRWVPPQRKPERIRGPQRRTAAYPDGTDYFELVGISAQGDRLFVLYTPDVDKQDFNQFRTPANLYTLKTDGSGFRKVKRTK